MKLEVLTPELSQAIQRMPAQRLAMASELRLRRGQRARLAFPWGEELLTRNGQGIPVTEEMLTALVDRATGFSPYALRLEETGLYLPLEQGCRMGLCGETVIREGKIWGLRHISSLVIRFAREIPGTARQAAERLTEGGTIRAALILSPPGGGKTTFLRDLIRCISERGLRVSVIDQRRELAAQRQGENTLELGPCTDVLSGCPKAEGMSLMLRVMNPQVLAVDELAGEDELAAAQQAAFSGVALLATAHAGSLKQVLRRPGYRALLESGAFQYVIELEQYRIRRMERIGDDLEAGSGRVCGGGVADEWTGGAAESQQAAGAAETAAAGTGAAARGDGAAHGVAPRTL